MEITWIACADELPPLSEVVLTYINKSNWIVNNPKDRLKCQKRVTQKPWANDQADYRWQEPFGGDTHFSYDVSHWSAIDSTPNIPQPELPKMFIPESWREGAERLEKEFMQRMYWGDQKPVKTHNSFAPENIAIDPDTMDEDEISLLVSRHMWLNPKQFLQAYGKRNNDIKSAPVRFMYPNNDAVYVGQLAGKIILKGDQYEIERPIMEMCSLDDVAKIRGFSSMEM